MIAPTTLSVLQKLVWGLVLLGGFFAAVVIAREVSRRQP